MASPVGAAASPGSAVAAAAKVCGLVAAGNKFAVFSTFRTVQNFFERFACIFRICGRFLNVFGYSTGGPGGVNGKAAAEAAGNPQPLPHWI